MATCPKFPQPFPWQDNKDITRKKDLSALKEPVNYIDRMHLEDAKTNQQQQ